ncbi:MAG: helix-turn-helix domain-containing protein [Acidobacteria bacterium]|jgi:transcriptional regulator with XRE-family HTH domain|nr:helix-turn-helix domain-containing protein [Acidobacteriota bacterium]
MKQENDNGNNTFEVGRRLKELRRVLDISQKDFASRIDITGSLLSEIESGKVKPGYHFLIAIAREYNINPTWVLLEDGEMFLNKNDHENVIIDKDEFGDQTLQVKEMLWYLKNSPLVQSTVLSFVSKFLYENEQSIQKDIEKAGSKTINNGAS